MREEAYNLSSTEVFVRAQDTSKLELNSFSIYINHFHFLDTFKLYAFWTYHIYKNNAY